MSKSMKEPKEELAEDCKSPTISPDVREMYFKAHGIYSDDCTIMRWYGKLLTTAIPIPNEQTADIMVHSPPHYNQGGIETIDYMKAYSTKEEFMGHCRLTAIKYLSRLMEKEKPLQDAMKAKWYLEKLIEELK